MKYFLSVIGIALLPLYNYAQNVASSKLKEEALGRCTGSAYCSACRNCSRCAHCSSGGTCGVCAPSSTSTSDYYSTKTANPKSKKPSKIASNKSLASPAGNKNIEVVIEELSLRSGPGNSYPLIEKLKRKQKLMLISKKDQWVKVKVVSSGNIGFCNIAHVR
ncbi:SH3 domain-containing protein [Pedobacter montanisoli]|uniref:SH3b domain-containing protein n=1 Tax=Pedobacter montanisoli TaxID=2923277 RepID=A0ABS9ZTB1_9SPHI|nr:hypothetical protein [Pedobacter montanisoli]MCJ0741840.1 hypothetical protein [Pedobacter montanisoli]